MTTHVINSGFAFYVPRVLGQIAALMGAILSVMWGLIFVLILAHEQYRHLNPEGAAQDLMGFGLPIEPPLVGLGIAGVALGILQMTNQKSPFSVIFGLVANCIPLLLALSLRLMGLVG
jgi:hypothetical protein